MDRRRALTIATFLVALSPLFSPAGRDLFVGDETKYSEIIREMRSSHSFFVPVLNGAPYSHKPPVHFWLIFLLSKFLGTFSIWPYVIPSLAAFLGMLVVMRRLGRELFADGDVAAFSAFVFSSSYLVWGLAQTARMDLGFTLFVSIGALWLYEFLESEDPRELYAAAAATAVGILIKGPMAFVVLLVLLILQRIRRKRLPAANYLLTFGIVLVIPLLWLVPAILRGGKDFGREIVITQNIGRAVGSWVHRAPPWFYVLRAPLTFFPWFLLVIVAIVAIARAGRREAASSPVDRRRASELFCIDWMLAVLIPFSVISGKLDIYMLPAFPPLALLIGNLVTRPPDESWARAASRTNLFTTALVALMGIAGLLASRSLPGRADERALMASMPVQMLLASMVAAGALGMVLQLQLRSHRLWFSTMVTGIAALTPLMLVPLLLLPTANAMLSTRPLVTSLLRQPGRGSEVALFACPYLWTRHLTHGLREVRYIDSDGLRQPDRMPEVLAARTTRAHELGRELPQNYRKVDEVRIRGMQFDVYRRR